MWHFGNVDGKIDDGYNSEFVDRHDVQQRDMRGIQYFRETEMLQESLGNFGCAVFFVG